MKRILFVSFVVLGLCSVALPVFGRGFGGGGGGLGGGGARGGIGGGGFGGGGAHGGFGGGGGGFGGGMGGGNFGGGARPNFGGGGLGGAGLGGGGFDRGGINGGLGGRGLNAGGRNDFGSGGLGGGFGGGLDRGGFNLDRANGFGGGNIGGGNFRANEFGGLGQFRQGQFNQPSRSELNNFLGLPSDEGMGSMSRGNFKSNEFDVNKGTVEGPRGGQAAGISVTGPQGNTVGKGVAVGPNGGVAAGRGFEGAGGAKGGQGVAVGPNGRVAAGAAVRAPDGGAAARGVIAGPNGVAAGFARETPSGRYTCAAAVRGNYNHWDVYGRGWYTAHPGAWYCAGWGAGYAWRAATWDSVGAWLSYYPPAPVYYDYGNNVNYQDNSVYVNGAESGSAEDYYNAGTALAAAGAQAEAPADGDWLPLGVFALTKTGQTQADVSIQLAVNKQGVIRGNYTDTVSGKTQVVQGSVDKQTQRVAFTVGDDATDIVETGLYNLTKDEAPALIHFGKDRTEQWLLVRLNQNDAPANP